MQLYTKDDFLSTGSAQLPSGAWRGVAIHPSSEVDLCIVEGDVLSPGAIVPVRSSTPSVQAVRRAGATLDGVAFGGGALVLQVYEACDVLVPPPGVLAPLRRTAKVAAADLGATVDAATLALRVPFAGRNQARISFKRSTNAADLSLLVVGASYGDRRQTDVGAQYTEDAEETWGILTGTAGALDGALVAKTVHKGGFGDQRELFDELLVYVYGAAGGDALVAVEAR